jgi:ectoine hydroxylase-related dioxygenase (phytanoyl-CoA dioxygenase family)
MNPDPIAAEGFAVLRGPFGADLPAAIETARTAIASASPSEVHNGSTTSRVNGILERAPSLAALLDYPALLEIARSICGGRFRLSSFHARGVRPGAPGQRLHQDVETGAEGWPLTGFIWMIDAFTKTNGATRFVPGSSVIRSLPKWLLTSHPDEVAACGMAGSLIVYDGSMWHGHGPNVPPQWRWSVQGAFVPGE